MFVGLCGCCYIYACMHSLVHFVAFCSLYFLCLFSCDNVFYCFASHHCLFLRITVFCIFSSVLFVLHISILFFSFVSTMFRCFLYKFHCRLNICCFLLYFLVFLVLLSLPLFCSIVFYYVFLYL